MERAKQHIIRANGERILRECFEPRWVVRKVESEDYGIDFEVEVFSDEGGRVHSTGFIFKVQLKSSESSNYSKSGAEVSVRVKKKHLAYYLYELRIPVIIIHADTSAKRLFWTSPQLDEQLRAFADARSNERVTLRIKTGNELPAGIERMLGDVSRAATSIATQTVISSPIPEFLHGLRSDLPVEEIARDLRDRSDAVRLHELQKLFHTKAYDQAEQVISKILADGESSVRNKYWALLEQERITWRKLYDAKSPQAQGPQAKLDIARRLQELTRTGPQDLKFAALIMRIAGELDVLVHRAYGLFLHSLSHKDGEIPILSIYAFLERTKAEQMVRRKYNQGVRLARYGMNSKYRASLCAALVRFVQVLPPYLIVLDHEKRAGEARQYRQSLFEILRLAAWIALRIREYNVTKMAANLAFQLSTDDFQELSKWADETVKSIDNPDERADAENWLTRARAGKERATRNRDEDNSAVEQQIYENMATSLGIPLDNPNHPLTKMFYSGVRDANPTSVLRLCKHSFVSLTHLSLPLQMLGEHLRLPLGPKLFECSKHGHTHVAKSAEDAHREFNIRFCQSCPDKEPQHEGWKFSPEWQEQQYEELGKQDEQRAVPHREAKLFPLC